MKEESELMRGLAARLDHMSERIYRAARARDSGDHREAEIEAWSSAIASLAQMLDLLAHYNWEANHPRGAPARMEE